MIKNHRDRMIFHHALLLLFFMLVMVIDTAQSQVPTLFYDFENNASRTTYENQVEQSVNSGSAALIRAGGSTSVLGASGAGVFNGGTDAGQGAVSDTWSSGTTDPGISATDYFEFVVSTSGLSGISLSFDNLASSTGPARAGILYSTDGSTFTSASTVLTGNTVWTTAGIDLSAVSALNNQASVTIRIYAYEGSSSDRTGRGTFDAAGTLTIDNVTVSASGVTASKTMLDYPGIGLSLRSGTSFTPTYTGLAVSGSGTVVSLASDINLSGTLSIGTGSDLRNPSGTGRTLTMTGSSSSIIADGTITGTDIGAGNDILLLVSGSGCTISGGGSLAQFLSLTVNNGSTLSLARTVEVKYVSTTINGTLQINNGGFLNRTGGSSITYGASSLLSYNPGTGNTYSAGNTTSEFPSTGVVNLGVTSGTLSIPGGVPRTVSGNVSISAGAAISLTDGLTLSGGGGTGMTVNGTLRVNTGGGFLSRSGGTTLTYGAASSLEYTGPYGVTVNEFPATGVANVRIVSGNGANSVTLGANRSISGNLTIEDGGELRSSAPGVVLTLSGASSSIIANGSGAITGTNTAPNDLSLVAGGTTTIVESGTAPTGILRFLNITVNNGSTLVLRRELQDRFGTVTVNGTLRLDNNTGAFLNTSVAGEAASVVYGAASLLQYNTSYTTTNNEFPATGVVNVTAGGTGSTLTLNGGKTITGTMTIGANSLAGGQAFSANSITLAGGSLTVSNLTTTGTGAALTATGSSSINVAGTWNVAGFSAGSGTVTFNGSSLQTVSTASTFNNLTINNPAGITLSPGVNPIVNGTLALTSGVVATGSGSVAIGAAGSVSRATGHIHGTLRKNVATGPTTRTFEVGDAAVYAPLTVAFGNVTVAGDLAVATVAGDHPNIGTSGLNASRSVNRYWTATNSGITFTTYDATFNFGAGDVDAGATTSNFIVRKYNAPTWSTTSTGARTGTSTQATGLTSFSDFAVGEIQTFTITATAAANGSITPSGTITVNSGDTQAFTISANTGYHIDSVVVDGVNQGAVTGYTFTNVTANHTISAYFSINVYTITATATGSGTITPAGAVAVNHGASQAFTVTPNTGYHIDSVVVDGVNQGAVTGYTFTNVTANHTINAYFSINRYTITATAGANGSISPSGAVLVNHGSNQAFAITPNTGYHVDSVVVDGVNQGAVTGYTFTNVTGNHTIVAYFSINVYTITAAATGNGTITPSGAIAVNHGASQAFTVTPNTGYHIDSVVVDGVNQGAVTGYTFTNVTANHTISAYFSINAYTITATATGSGTITPAGAVAVNHGASQAFTVTPNTGYHIDSVVVDGVNQGAVTGYTFTNVTANHTINAYFSINRYTITATAGANGSISPSGAVLVNHGSSQAFTITPNTGYHVDSVVVDGVNQGAVTGYTFTNVTANQTIAAYFSINFYTITATMTGNGTITPSGVISLSHGSNQSFTISAASGYHIDSVVVDGVNQGAITGYSFTNVTSNRTIAAYVSINVYTIIATAAPNGTIAPSGNVPVNHGSNRTFIVAANTGYHLDSVVVDGFNIGAVTSYTFTNVTSGHTINAYFTINTYTITAAAGPNGSISPAGAVPVTFGSNQTFTMLPNSGYHVDSVIVDGVNQGALTSYSFTGVSTNHTITAYFAINAFTITASAGPGGIITPSGSVNANFGSNQAFTITPNTGYHIDSVVVDGFNQGAITSYAFTNITSDHAISAYFSINIYTITATAGVNGTISPSGSIPVAHGSDQSFTITPVTGYHIDSVLVDGVNQGAVPAYTFTGVAGNRSISAFFSINIYTISASVVGNGTITPSGAVQVTYGSAQAFTIAPSPNHHIDSVIVDGVNQGAITSYTFSNVVENHSIIAHVSIDRYIITSVAGVGGTISPSGAVPVNHGADQTFTISPSVNFHIDSVVVDGVNLGPLTTYTFSNVTAPHTINAYFTVTGYIISATASTGGTITPSGDIGVLSGTSQSFTLAANTGYHIDSLVVDGVNQGALSSYNFTNVTSNHTIAAYFSIDLFTITATAGANGSISPSGAVNVPYATDQSFTITPATGYHIDSVLVDGVNQGALASYTFTGVTAPHTITAFFSINVYTITVSAGANGTITPGTTGVNHGSDQSFVIAPNPNYHIDSVVVDGVNLGAITAYTFSNVTAAHTIAAYFSIDTYTVLASATAGGVITPAGAVVVQHGSSQTFTMTPDPNHHLDSIVVDGINQGAIPSYTFTDVTSPHTINAYFSIDTYSITAGVTGSGSITPSGVVSVNHGADQGFVIAADPGYHIDSVVVDGIHQGAISAYQFTAVTAPHTIQAYISINIYTITASASAGGSISPAGIININHGLSQTFTLTPDPGYHVDSLVVDGINLGALSAYTFDAVSASHTISAYFSINSYTITASATAGGIISPAGPVVLTHGSSQTFVLTPDIGYHIDSLVVDGVNLGAIASYDFVNVVTGHTIDAYFSIDVFTIAAASTANGSISPAGSVPVNYGSDITFTFTPDPGYHVDSVYVDGLPVPAAPAYTFTGVTANHTIAVTFVLDQFTITSSSSSGGTISPVGVQNVLYGSTQSFTITPDVGYHIDSVVVDGINQGAVPTYTFTNIAASHVIAAYFSIDRFIITATPGLNGTISPSGAVSVPYSSSQVFTISPATGYHIDSVVVDGANLGILTEYTFTNVTSPHTIAAYFSINYYTITSTAGPTGSISPAGIVSLSYGASQTYTITPSTGYHIDSVVVDGVNQGQLPSYTFTAIDANHTIAAYFSINAYIITATAGSGGTITPSGSVGVSHGGIQSFVATPNPGYHIDSLVVDGINLGAVANYTFTNVTAPHTIAAYFSINSYTLTAVAGANGIISPAGILSVQYGASQTFSITPNTGYHIDSVIVDGVNVGAPTIYAFTNISANHTIVAYFSGNIYIITATAAPGGAISPSGLVSVNYNASQNFLIIPNAGFHIDSVLINGTNLGPITSYTFTNVMTNHTIQAFFTFNSYTVTATAQPGGTISPSGIISVTQGANIGFTITPLFGYHIDSVIIDGANLGPITNYVFTNVTSSHTITAHFSLMSYTITAVAAGNGTISPDGAVPVTHGTSQAFTIAANNGYHIDSVVVDGANAGPITSYTFNTVVTNHTIIAYFSGNIQTITAIADSGGTITPSGIISIPYGSSQEFTIAANYGYHIDSVVVDGINQGAVELYRFTSISTNHSINAYFSPNIYTITSSVVGSGTISPSGVAQVPHGGGQVYTITPSTGYHVDSVVINGSNVGILLSYTFANVVANHVIVAYISINTYSITATASGGGTITPSGVINVPGGGNRTFTMAALTGNHLDSVVVDGINRGAITTYTFSNVQTSHAIIAYYSINIYTITATAVGGGRISPSGSLSVSHGSNRMFTMAAPNGYHIDSVVVDGTNRGVPTVYTFTNVTSSHVITAYFSENRYALTLTVTGNGRVTRVPNQALYEHGTVVTLTAIPDSGWVFDGWSGAVSGNANPIYVSMTAPRAITASFSQYRYRTATYQQWATTVNGDQRLKPVKNEPDKVSFMFDLLVESNPVLFLDFSMDVTGGVVMRGEDTLARFTGKRPLGMAINAVSGETVQVAGIGLKGKPMKAKYSWGSVNKTTVTTFVRNSPLLPLPNLHNVGEELFLQNAFGFGLLVGVPQGAQRGNSVLHSRYRDVQKSLNHNGALHTGRIRCIGFFDATGSPINRQQKTLSADRHNNKLFAEVLTLKLNVAASAYNSFPNGFGELTFSDPANVSNPFNGLMVNDIAELADSFLSCVPGAIDVSDSLAMFSTLQMLNRAFADSLGAVDTIGFAVKTQLRGVRTLDEVPYLRPTPNVQPVSVNARPDFSGTIPQQYALEQNYPNPFNPSTTIQFTLPTPSLVTISVYNMLGQQVATLIDREALDEGVQEVEFDAGSLPSGVYFYRLSAEELASEGDVLGLAFTDVKRMMLIK